LAEATANAKAAPPAKAQRFKDEIRLQGIWVKR